MYSYTAYGLLIHSDIELPELIEAAGETACAASLRLYIRVGKIDRARPPDADPSAPFWATPDAVFLQYPTAAAYLVCSGREIAIDPQPEVDPRIVRLFLLGPALAVLLHQRGLLVLHASAVRMNGGAVAFVGDKGMGKSTMAAAMNARGHALVADDIVAIDMAGDVPLAYPGFPQLKLFPESAAQLTADARGLPRLHPEFDKRAARAESNFTQDPLPLAGVFELIDADHEAVEAPPPQQAFMQLVRHSYLLSLLPQTNGQQSHFRQAVRVAARVPVRRLLRRRSMADLPEVARLVEESLADRG